MEADAPAPSPRQERFRRYTAFGHTLTEATKRADKKWETDLRARIEAEAYERARAELAAQPVLSGPFHDISDEPDAIDVVIADIDGTSPLRSAKAAPTMTDHDIPGLVRRWRVSGAWPFIRTGSPAPFLLMRYPRKTDAPRLHGLTRLWQGRLELFMNGSIWPHASATDRA